MGQVAGIFISPIEGAPMRSLEHAEVAADRGIVGDRYFGEKGPGRGKPEKSRDVTVFGVEAVDTANAESGLDIQLSEMRRNIAVSGVDVESLVGKRFTIGGVEFEGTETCHPCTYLQDLAGREIRKPLQGRSGVRAKALGDGELNLGDEVVVLG